MAADKARSAGNQHTDGSGRRLGES
jgi:hypothetical protein